ncbi:hypothetical protein D3C75_945420 [compost metagenome]
MRFIPDLCRCEIHIITQHIGNKILCLNRPRLPGHEDAPYRSKHKDACDSPPDESGGKPRCTAAALLVHPASALLLPHNLRVGLLSGLCLISLSKSPFLKAGCIIGKRKQRRCRCFRVLIQQAADTFLATSFDA